MTDIRTRGVCISVIIPVFNTGEYLDRCVDSVTGQTHKNLDIILVDDGSTDMSAAICDRAAAEDHRVKVIHKENAGLVAARETGISAAKGDYVTFVDSDDYIELDAYERMLSGLAAGKPDVIACGLVEEYESHSLIKSNRFAPGRYGKHDLIHKIYPRMICYDSFFEFGILPNLVVKLFRRDFLTKAEVRVNRRVSVGEDADAVYRLLLRAETLQIVDTAPYHYCRRNESMMLRRLEDGALLALENDFDGALRTSEYKGILMEQLQKYMAFVTLLKDPRRILKGGYGLTGRTALYGAGGFGRAVQAAYPSNITLWVDRNYDRHTSLCFPVDPAENLQEKSGLYDSVFIAILNVPVCREIKQALIRAGVRKPVFYYGENRDWR